jgi:ribonuclease Z
VAAREVTILGTASAVPTRLRNHVGLFLRWDDLGVLIDPGEGTQRQMTLAGVTSSSIDVIWLTHLHGDHCLGLPGVLQRRVVDGITRPLHLVHPAAGERTVEALLIAHGGDLAPLVVRHPVQADGPILSAGDTTLSAVALDHRVPTYGMRLQEADGFRVLPEEAKRRGIEGPDIGRLLRESEIEINGRRVVRDEITANRTGQAAAVVMDTRWCEGALRLADGADLLISESTFLSSYGEDDMAQTYGHLTARQAGELATRGGARRLVLQHYSQRHPDEQKFAVEARSAMGGDPDVIAAVDLQTIRVPRRST